MYHISPPSSFSLVCAIPSSPVSLRFFFSSPVLIAMDSRNPYSQSSSYMGLLNSQNFPYESFPQFSSQQTDAGTQSEDTPVDRKERRKWTPSDDDVLISGWLNTSKDAIVGNDQKSGSFWKRVGEYVAASPHAREGFYEFNKMFVYFFYHFCNFFFHLCNFLMFSSLMLYVLF